MSEIVNLRHARKRAARAARDKQAAENRAKFGMSKADRAARDADATKNAKAVEQAKRDEPAS